MGKKASPHSCSKTPYREACGQGIIEGITGTYMIVSVSVLLILLLINVGFLFLYQQKADRVASEVADVLNNGHYWLNSMAIKDYDLQAHLPEGTMLADSMLAKLGLTRIGEIEAVDEPIKLSDTTSGFITQVRFNATYNNFVLQRLFGSIIKIKAQGISSEIATEAQGTCTLHFKDQDPHNPLLRNVRFPIYFCGISNHTTDYVIPKGTFVGNPKHAYLGLEAHLFRGVHDHPAIHFENGDEVLPYWGTGGNNEYDPDNTTEIP